MIYFVYIIRGYLSNGQYRYYRGYTDNIKRRFAEHKRAKKNKYTARFKGNIELVYLEIIEHKDKKIGKQMAKKRENQLKNWKRPRIEKILREKKEELNQLIHTFL